MKDVVNVNREDWIREKAIQISSNAIAAYRLIRRYGKILPRLMKSMKENLHPADYPLKDVEILEFPDKEDFLDSSGGILRLHVFYKLNVTEVCPSF